MAVPQIQVAQAPDMAVEAPTVRHSGNDWAARKRLENLETAASSITNQRRWGGQGDRSPDVVAFQQAFANDLAMQGAEANTNQAAMRERGENARAVLGDIGASQRANLQEQGAGARAALSETGADRRLAMQETGQNTRQLLSSTAAVQAAQVKADAAAQAKGGPTAGYRLKTDGTGWEAIPGGPADLKNNKEGIQQGKDTQDIFSILKQARPLLKTATGSPLGAGADQVAAFFGHSTEGAKSTAQLKALQGALVAKMPKMSGPQSDKDVQLYREMAGQIGDPTIPVEQRRAAMDTIERLNLQYLPVASDENSLAQVPSGGWFRAPNGSIRRKP